MRIKWLGHACFKLDFGGLKVITDPYDETVGYSLPLGDADLVTVSHDHFDHNHVAGVSGSPEVLSGPGSKEARILAKADLKVTGFPSFHDAEGGKRRGSNTIFRFQAPDLTLVHLGDLGHLPGQELVSELAGADVLLIPVGGTFTLDAAGAEQTVNLLKPKVVIPMHYKTDALKFDLAGVDDFARRFSNVKDIGEAEITLEAKNLPETGATLVYILDYARK
ncbi:MAG: MBL fold metallo-hydrolase [Firmicutes bacterium]|nr:MBL fold metallo-hydrolase [Bacillota bacterium]